MPIEDIAIADLAIAAVVLVSAAFGLMRGFVKEVVALVIWVGAAVLGTTFGPVVADSLGLDLSARLQSAVGFATVFVVVLVVGALVQRLLRGLVTGTGLTGTDRTLGLLFGTARGVAVVLVALILLRPFAAERAWWNASVLAPPLLALEGDLLEIRDVVVGAFGELDMEPADAEDLAA